jgi:hypothetical protein
LALVHFKAPLLAKGKSMKSLYASARFNGASLRAEMAGSEKVVRAHCYTCDNSGAYCYTDVDSLILDMADDRHFYGKWEFVIKEKLSTVHAFCPSCVSKKTK